MIKYKLRLFKPAINGYVLKFKNENWYLIRHRHQANYSLINYYNSIYLYDHTLRQIKEYIETKRGLNNIYLLKKMIIDIQYDILKLIFEDILYISGKL